MVWNCSIVAVTLLFGVSGKSKAFRNAGKTELSCKIIDADDEWIKICYTEKKDKQVAKLMRIENIESIEEQIFKACGENDRAEYGKKLLEYLSEQLTAEFGKGFVLIDLKVGKLSHQDLGPMQMYVN